MITEFTPSYDVYISQLIRFVRICNNVSDCNGCNLVITEERLHRGYLFFILKAFIKFYYHNKDLLYKYNSTYRVLIKKEISYQCLDDDVMNKVNKFKSDTFKLIINLTNLISKGYDSTTIIVSLIL